MRTGIIGTKIGTSSFFNEDGFLTPITLIKVDKCIVSDVKTKEKNGYCAVQLSSIDKKSKNPKINKAQKKLFSAIDTLPKKIVKEFRVIEDNLLEIGTSIDISHYEKKSIHYYLHLKVYLNQKKSQIEIHLFQFL